MTGTFDRLRALHLAGTISIPSPFPQVGCISLVTLQSPGNSRKSAVQQRRTAQVFLRVEHIQSPRLMIARSVALSEVQAIFLPENPYSPHLDRGDWFVGGTGQSDITKLLGGPAKNASTLGIVYVKEAAPVLMQVEVAMTAAESAEYYPPVVRDRSDAHYDLGVPLRHPGTTCDCSEVRQGPIAYIRPASCDCSEKLPY